MDFRLRLTLEEAVVVTAVLVTPTALGAIAVTIAVTIAIAAAIAIAVAVRRAVAIAVTIAVTIAAMEAFCGHIGEDKIDLITVVDSLLRKRLFAV